MRKLSAIPLPVRMVPKPTPETAEQKSMQFNTETGQITWSTNFPMTTPNEHYLAQTHSQQVQQAKGAAPAADSGKKEAAAPSNKGATSYVDVSNSQVGSQAPTNEAPVNQVPVSQAPVSQAPVSQAPPRQANDLPHFPSQEERGKMAKPLDQKKPMHQVTTADVMTLIEPKAGIMYNSSRAEDRVVEPLGMTLIDPETIETMDIDVPSVPVQEPVQVPPRQADGLPHFASQEERGKMAKPPDQVETRRFDPEMDALVGNLMQEINALLPGAIKTDEEMQVRIEQVRANLRHALDIYDHPGVNRQHAELLKQLDDVPRLTDPEGAEGVLEVNRYMEEHLREINELKPGVKLREQGELRRDLRATRQLIRMRLRWDLALHHRQEYERMLKHVEQLLQRFE